MTISGYYYLHVNGDLIYKQNLPGTYEDLIKSVFVRRIWLADTSNRERAWDILVEASALGANMKKIEELKEKWGCDNDDALIYADRKGIVLKCVEETWCAAKEEDGITQTGRGNSALEAMAKLFYVCEEKP